MDSEAPAEGLTYDPEIGPGYFTQIRSDFLRFGGYSPTMKLCYLVLLSYAGAGATAWPGQVRLARECAVSERTIRTVLQDLASVGLLTIKQQGLNKTNLYHVRKLPLVMAPTKDRQRLPVQNGKARRSKAATVADKVDSVQLQTVETGSDAVNQRAFFDSQIRALCRERRWPAPSRADLNALAATGYDALVVGNTARLGTLASLQELIAAFRPGGLGPLGLGK